jgi:hypothetical protein
MIARTCSPLNENVWQREQLPQPGACRRSRFSAAASSAALGTWSGRRDAGSCVPAFQTCARTYTAASTSIHDPERQRCTKAHQGHRPERDDLCHHLLPIWKGGDIRLMERLPLPSGQTRAVAEFYRETRRRRKRIVQVRNSPNPDHPCCCATKPRDSVPTTDNPYYSQERRRDGQCPLDDRANLPHVRSLQNRALVRAWTPNLDTRFSPCPSVSPW